MRSPPSCRCSTRRSRGARRLEAAPETGDSALLSPVLALQARHSVKLATIAGDDDQRAAARVAGYQKIVTPDRSALPLERRTNFGCVMRSRDVERQDLEPGGEVLDLPAVCVWTGRFCGAVQKLRQHNR
jgi:hypothetical protein